MLRNYSYLKPARLNYKLQARIYKKKWIFLMAFELVFLIPAILYPYTQSVISYQMLGLIGIFAGVLAAWSCYLLYRTTKAIFNSEEKCTDYRWNIISYYHTRRYMNYIAFLLILAIYTCAIKLCLDFYEKGDFSIQWVKVFLGAGICAFALAFLIALQLREELKTIKLLIIENKPVQSSSLV